MISALPFLLMMAAPPAANVSALPQKPAAPLAVPKLELAVRAQVTILRAAIISAVPPKDGMVETDREYHRRTLVPMVEFY